MRLAAWVWLWALHVLALLVHPAHCGKVAGRVGNAEESENEIAVVGPGEHPYLAAIVWKSELICIGSLIHESWVISSANCFNAGQPNSTYRIRFGSYSFQDQFQYEQSVDAIVYHPGFDSFAFKYNVALLKLKSPAILNKGVLPIKLPKASMMSKDFGGSTGIVLGWRALEKPKYLPVVRRSEYVIYPAGKCRSNFEASAVPLDICVSQEEKRFGASVVNGSPLLFYNMVEDTYYLIGIHSGVKSEGTAPLKFTRISPILSWITNVVGIPIQY